jgi:hypothetical protein
MTKKKTETLGQLAEKIDFKAIWKDLEIHCWSRIATKRPEVRIFHLRSGERVVVPAQRELADYAECVLAAAGVVAKRRGTTPDSVLEHWLAASQETVLGAGPARVEPAKNEWQERYLKAREEIQARFALRSEQYAKGFVSATLSYEVVASLLAKRYTYARFSVRYGGGVPEALTVELALPGWFSVHPDPTKGGECRGYAEQAEKFLKEMDGAWPDPAVVQAFIYGASARQSEVDSLKQAVESARNPSKWHPFGPFARGPWG